VLPDLFSPDHVVIIQLLFFDQMVQSLGILCNSDPLHPIFTVMTLHLGQKLLMKITNDNNSLQQKDTDANYFSSLRLTDGTHMHIYISIP